MRSAALMAAAAPLSALAHHGQPHIPRIYMILYRGETPVEQGFSEYFADQKLETELIVRNVELDTSRVPALLAEARALGADLIYTWGTPVTLAVAGKEGEVNPDVHETEIPIVFTMVAAPRGGRRRELAGFVPPQRHGRQPYGAGAAADERHPGLAPYQAHRHHLHAKRTQFAIHSERPAR